MALLASAFAPAHSGAALEVETFRVAGRYVAYSASSPAGCKADCPPDAEGTTELGVFNVATNRHRTVHDERRVGAIGLTRGGVLVWTALDQAGNGVVRMRASRSRRTLDRGAVDRRSLSVRGRTASWTNAGVPRRARFPAR